MDSTAVQMIGMIIFIIVYSFIFRYSGITVCVLRGGYAYHFSEFILNLLYLKTAFSLAQDHF